MRTIFGFEVEGVEGLDEQTVYLYYLPQPDTPEGAPDAKVVEAASAAQAALAAQLSHLHPTPGAGSQEPGSFRPNLTASRTVTDKPLDVIVDERRRDLLARGRSRWSTNARRPSRGSPRTRRPTGSRCPSRRSSSCSSR